MGFLFQKLAAVLLLVADLLARKPAPAPLVALYLALRWRCIVSWKADVHYPFNIRLGAGTIIPGRCTLIASGDGISIGKRVELHEGSYLHCQGGSISVGDETAIGPYVVIYGGGGVFIGTFCGIATHTAIVSTSHVADRSDVPIRAQGSREAAVNIADDVWVGMHCSVAMGVTIGEGSILGAGTVLLRSVEPRSVVVGVPGGVVRTR
ncbi:MAG: acyltransferase [Sulfuritalea sp.]|nr:acyltransferase [Sulfuritalea sp.]